MLFMEPKKRMTVSLDEQVERMLENIGREREQAYQSVRKGESKGRIDPDGSVTVIVDAISSVHYDAHGIVTYIW